VLEDLDVFKYSFRLSSLRRKSGLSQREVAKELMVTPASLSAYEKGTKMPSMEVAIKLAGFYKVSLDYIFRPLKAEYDTLSTYADALKCLFKLTKGGLDISISTEDPYDTEFGFSEGIATISFTDSYLYEIFTAWRGLLESNKNGVVDDEILELWEKKKLEQAGKKNTPQAQEVLDAIAADDEELIF
jgi:Predicted transcriptional regulators